MAGDEERPQCTVPQSPGGRVGVRQDGLQLGGQGGIAIDIHIDMEPPLLSRPVVVWASSSLLAAAAILFMAFAISSAGWYYFWSIAYADEVAAGAVVSESF